MALFGTEMVDVTTPDGRRVTLPQQLAQQFPGLAPAPAIGQPPSELPAIPDFAPQGSPAGALPPPAPAPVPPQDGPVTAPSQAPPGPVNAAPPPPVIPPVPPQPKPPTDAELAARGVGAGLQQQNAASDKQEAVVRDEAKLNADVATQVGNRMAQRDEETARLLEERKQIAEQQQQALVAQMQQRQQMSDKIANTKIDRTRDHSILNMIGLVLGTIGNAMQNQQATLVSAFSGGTAKPIENQAIAAFYQALDRKVAAQMQDIEKGRSDIGEKDRTITIMRQSGLDRLQKHDVLIDAARQQAVQQIETIKAKSDSPRAKIAADKLLADIAGKRAADADAASKTAYERIQNEQKRKDTLRMHDQTVGVALRGQNMQQRQFDQGLAERQRERDMLAQEKLDTIAAQLTGQRAKAFSEATKDNEARGIGDPGNDGNRFLQPEGVALNKQADAADREALKFQQAAQKEKDPNKRDAMLARAQAESTRANDMRADAAIKHTWRLGSPEIADKMGIQVGATQTIADAAGEINAMRDKHGAKWLFSTEGEAWMQSRGAQLSIALKDAWGLGILSKQDFELIDKASGGDPTNLTPGDFIKVLGLVEGTQSRLNSLVSGVETSTRNNMRARGFKGEYKVKRDIAAKRTPEEQAAVEALRSETPVESAAGQERGTLGKAVETILNPVGEKPAARRSREAIDSGSTTHPGLSTTQAGAVDFNLNAYAKGGDKAQRAAETLVSMATDASRPALQNAMLSTLKARAPDLYERAVGQLPAQDAGPVGAAPVVNQQDIATRQQTLIAQQPTRMLAEFARGGDKAALQELQRRIVAGDPEALSLFGSKGRK